MKANWQTFFRLRPYGKTPIFTEQSHLFNQAQKVVWGFYLLALAVGVLRLEKAIFGLVEAPYPLWILRWLPIDPTLSVLLWVVFAAICVVNPRIRLARVGVFVGMFCYIAYTNSFGKINHAYHFFLYISFFAILLPSTSQKGRLYRQNYLNVFLSIQVLLAGCYTLSGLFKFEMLFEDMFFQEGATLSANYFQIFIADFLSGRSKTPPLSTLVLDYPRLFAPSYHLGALVEIMALPLVFFRRWHRPLGYALVALHVGILLMMGISFLNHTLLLILIFVSSPFASRPAKALHKPSAKLTLISQQKAS